ncbi:MAG: protease inhibitor I42 family protein [Methanoregula sp.]|nr:protease inhibitor I42 family protein [Methanoregula sp.]
MKSYLSLIGVGILCCAVIAVAGCLNSGSQNPTEKTIVPTVEETPVMEGHVAADEAQNGSTVYVNTSANITLTLKENPTTGYSWNLSVTPGLAILNDTYVSSDPSGKLMGAGGTHTWEITAEKTGTQKIQGIYMRPWENVTGNETTFTMTVIVQ